ncbi:MAG: ABC transporter permease subunit [Planctomycetes bacterium]|nr:ABC transporter permease subunit [Planctomycetota bacterium]
MRRELKLTLGATLAITFVIELLLVPAILFWPRFEDKIELLSAMAPLQVLKDQLGYIEQTGVVGYTVAQHFFKVCSTLGVLAAALLSAPAVAGHALRGTLELCLARPLSRRRMLFERWLLGAFALCAPIFLSTATIPPLVARIDETLEQAPLAWCALHQSLFLLAIYSLGFLGSCLSRNPWLVAGAVLFGGLLQFALYMIETATHWSLFRLSDVPTYIDVYQQRALDPQQWIPLAATSAVALGCSFVAFARRVP